MDMKKIMSTLNSIDNINHINDFDAFNEISNNIHQEELNIYERKIIFQLIKAKKADNLFLQNL